MGYIGLIVLAIIIAAVGEALRARALQMPYENTLRIEIWDSFGIAFIAAGITALIVFLFFFLQDYIFIWFA